MQRREIRCPHIVARDTVGAGDCFVGTFGYLVYQYLKENSFENISRDQLGEIVQKCCNASSFSVQFEGGCDKYPTKIMDLSSFCQWKTTNKSMISMISSSYDSVDISSICYSSYPVLPQFLVSSTLVEEDDIVFFWHIRQQFVSSALHHEG